MSCLFKRCFFGALTNLKVTDAAHNCRLLIRAHFTNGNDLHLDLKQSTTVLKDGSKKEITYNYQISITNEGGGDGVGVI